MLYTSSISKTKILCYYKEVFAQYICFTYWCLYQITVKPLRWRNGKHHNVCLIPSLVKPKTVKLIFDALPIKQHWGARTNTACLRVRTMCRNGVIRLALNCCFPFQCKNLASHVCLVKSRHHLHLIKSYISETCSDRVMLNKHKHQ